MNVYRRMLATLSLLSVFVLGIFFEACTCGPSPSPTTPTATASSWTPPGPQSASSTAGSPTAAPGSAAPSANSGGTMVKIVNDTGKQATVYVAFGADSAVTGWPFCTSTGRLNCNFALDQNGGARELPLGGKYLNATFSFDAPPG